MGLYDNVLAQAREQEAMAAIDVPTSQATQYGAARGMARAKQGARQMFGIEEPAVIQAKAAEARQAKLNGIVSKYSTASTRADFTAAFSELMAGGFPEEAAKMQEHLKNMPKPVKPATSIEEFQFYVDRGGTEDYMTFLKDKLGDEDNITSQGLKLVEDKTTKSGYRYIPIEGGEAWQKAEDEKQAALVAASKEGSQLSTKSQTEFVMNRELDSAIDYIVNQTPGRPVTGKLAEGFMMMSPIITANSDAQGLRANIETIKGIIGFERLQRMREESKTGGALGQVAVQELIALQGTLGNLNLLAPTEDILEKLRDIKDIYNRNMDIVRQEYSAEDLAKYGYAPRTDKPKELTVAERAAAELARRNNNG